MKLLKSYAISFALVYLGIVATALIAATAQEFTGTIAGIVVDAQGKSVAGAWVTVGCGDRPLGGRIPGVFSDEQGHFAVGSLELAECSVYACNEQADIPCLTSVNPASVVHVTLSASVPTATVKVRLGEKGTVISGTVRDAITGEKLAAMFEYYQLKFPDRRSSMSSGADFRIFIAPLTDYNLTISAPGYKYWQYSADHPLHRSIRLAPHGHLYLEVKLNPTH
jgi:hypothetical protein